MKKLLLILLLIVGCEETGLNTESLTDGTSVTDTLYVVNYDTTFVYDTLIVSSNDTLVLIDSLIYNQPNWACVPNINFQLNNDETTSNGQEEIDPVVIENSFHLFTFDDCETHCSNDSLEITSSEQPGGTGEFFSFHCIYYYSQTDTIYIESSIDTLYIEENNENFISVDWILVKNDEMWEDEDVFTPGGNSSYTFYSGTGYTFFGNSTISNHSLNTLEDDGILFFDYKTETFNYDLTDSYHNEAEKYFINSNNHEHDVSNIYCYKDMTYCHIIQDIGWGYILDLRSPFQIVDYR